MPWSIDRKTAQVARIPIGGHYCSFFFWLFAAQNGIPQAIFARVGSPFFTRSAQAKWVFERCVRIWGINVCLLPAEGSPCLGRGFPAFAISVSSHNALFQMRVWSFKNCEVQRVSRFQSTVERATGEVQLKQLMGIPAWKGRLTVRFFADGDSVPIPVEPIVHSGHSLHGRHL